MKRLVPVLMLTMSLLSAGAVDRFLEPFQPVTPDILARGMAVTASVRGLNSLWINPAGLARPDKKAWTVLDLQSDFYIPVSQINPLVGLMTTGQISKTDPMDPDSADTLNFVQALLEDNGFGGNLNFIPLGLVTNGLGFSLALNMDLYASGKTLLGTTARFDTVIGGGIGYALPFNLGPVKLYTGIGIRPMYRVTSDIPILDRLGSIKDPGALTETLTVGVAPTFAIDVGTIAEWGDWSFGLTLRDAGSPVQYEQHSFTSVLTRLFNMGGGDPSKETVYTPISLSGGVAWEPSLGVFSKVVKSVTEVDLTIPLKGALTPSWGTWIHAGTELTVLDYLSVRLGLNQGYLTAGMGVRLGIWESNLALYSKELGIFAGENRRSSIVFETGLKF